VTRVCAPLFFFPSLVDHPKQMFVPVALLLCLFVASTSGTWHVITYFSGTTCSGNPIQIFQFDDGSACTPSGCVVAGTQSFVTSCQSTPDGSPNNYNSLVVYPGSTCQAFPGWVQSWRFLTPSVCVPAFSGAGSTFWQCSATGLTVKSYSQYGCVGTESPFAGPLPHGTCSLTPSNNGALAWCPGFTTTAGVTTSPSSSPTVWSGNYQVTSTCNTGCCCVSGTFSLTQVGTQVSGTLPLTSSCGVASIPVLVTLATSTSTSFSITLGGQTLNIVKSGDTVTLTNTAAPQCSGAATCTSGDCRSATSTVCFHESTTISYKGSTFSLANVPTNECRVPHVVTANGVRVETTCSNKEGGTTTATTEHGKNNKSPLRLTEDHLVFTSSGLRPASTLMTGDVLFADVDQKHHCTVTRIERETSQRYFGLNCLESVVLANGIKTSTFGRYHHLPATWMRYAGQVLGVDRASRWGDHIVDLLARMKLL
jgi:hypothetical protein